MNNKQSNQTVISYGKANQFLKKDKAFYNELKFCYNSIFEYYVKEWTKSIIQQMTVRRDG